MKRDSLSQKAVLWLVNRGAVQIGCSLSDEVTAIEELITRYENVPISLAKPAWYEWQGYAPKARS